MSRTQEQSLVHALVVSDGRHELIAYIYISHGLEITSMH